MDVHAFPVGEALAGALHRDLGGDLGGDGALRLLGLPVLLSRTSNSLGSLQIRIAWARQRCVY